MVKEKSEYVRYDISIDGKKTFVYASRWLSDKQAKEDIKSRFDDCKVTNIKKYRNFRPKLQI